MHLSATLRFLVLIAAPFFLGGSVSAQTPAYAGSSAPLLFTANRGQVVDNGGTLHPEVRFTAHSRSTRIFITASSIHYQFMQADYNSLAGKEDNGHSSSLKGPAPHPGAIRTHRFTLSLLGAASAPTIHTEEVADYTESFYLPHCPNGITGVPTCSRIVFEGVYPGIDWVVYSRGGTLKHDFIIHPGADYRQVRLGITGADGITITPTGELLLTTSLGTVTEAAPISFAGGHKVSTHFIKGTDGTIGFSVDNYNTSLPLTIDPSVSWATYFGDSNYDFGGTCAADRSGNVYLTGYSLSGYALSTTGAYQTSNAGNYDGFLVKFSPNGTRLWATYYGGPADEIVLGIAVDKAGAVYMVGNTQSASGIAFGGFKTVFGGGNYSDAFLVKFTPAGTRRWSTYYGDTGDDHGYSCAVDDSGNVFLAGDTNSPFYISSGGFQDTYGGGGNADAMLIKFDSTGGLRWATYYGGTGDDRAYACTTDGAGNVFLAGAANSQTAIASTAGFQTYNGGSYDAFIAGFSPSGARLWGTYCGGTSDDYGFSCTTDGVGNVFLAGRTASLSGIASGGFQNAFAGISYNDAFLVKYNSTGTRLWGTYYGGTDDESGTSCVSNSLGEVYLAGSTVSTTGIAQGGVRNIIGGGSDAFLAKFNAAGTRQWATYYGGTNNDNANSCVLEGPGNVYLSGETGSFDNIATTGSFMYNYAGGLSDDYILKLSNYSQGIPGPNTQWPGSLSIYPDPASDHITIEGEWNIPTTGIIHIELINALGQRVYATSASTVTSHLNLSIPLSNTIVNGIYTLTVAAAGSAVSKTILIRH